MKHQAQDRRQVMALIEFEGSQLFRQRPLLGLVLSPISGDQQDVRRPARVNEGCSAMIVNDKNAMQLMTVVVYLMNENASVQEASTFHQWRKQQHKIFCSNFYKSFPHHATKCDSRLDYREAKANSTTNPTTSLACSIMCAKSIFSIVSSAV